MASMIYFTCFMLGLSAGYLIYLNRLILRKLSTLGDNEGPEPHEPEPEEKPNMEHFVARKKIRYRTEQDEYRDEVS